MLKSVKTEISLKSILIGPVSYDECSPIIWSIDKNGGMQRIADVRSYGAIQKLFKDRSGSVDFDKAGEFQDKLGQFIVDAINEKMERDLK